MMGKVRRRQEDLFYYGFKLERRVPQEHVLRRVLEKVDFSFVREQVRDHYGTNGNASEDPIVILKLMFLLFFDNVKSERELMRVMGMRLDYLWFLGFDLDDEIPHHSILSKARRRWGAEVFQELFVQVVMQCVEAGLVEGSKIHVDGSLVQANASIDSIQRKVEQLYAVQEGKLEEMEVPSKSRGKGKWVSRTDPEAAVVRKGRGDRSRPRYKHHRGIDDQCGVITALKTTSGEGQENQEMLELVEQHEHHTSSKVTTVVADSQYGTNENFAECYERGIRSHMADLQWKNRNKSTRQGIFSLEEFRYDPQEDCYLCPAGQRLKCGSYDSHRKRYQYRIAGSICNACALKPQCTRSSQGRTLKRYLKQEEIDRARLESHSTRARQDRRRRKTLIEGSFADATNNHHFKHARWRGLERQGIQDLLIAVCQNVRILLRAEPLVQTAQAWAKTSFQLVSTALASVITWVFGHPRDRESDNGLAQVSME